MYIAPDFDVLVLDGSDICSVSEVSIAGGQGDNSCNASEQDWWED